LIDIGEYKKAMKQINSYLDKGAKKMHVVEKLYYKVVKSYTLDKSNRKQEALQEMDEVLKEIVDQSINDGPLID